MSILTTVTPVWRRPEMLRGWLKCIKAASIPSVRHFIYFIGEQPPHWWSSEVADAPVITLIRQEPPGLSIGHYHNIGFEAASSEWVMKLDIDTLPNTRFFKELMPILENGADRTWYNAGMFYVNEASTAAYLSDMRLPLGELVYEQIIENSRYHSSHTYLYPAASNFICRKKDYLATGGCLKDFRGYGWEDYQQMYALESHRLNGECPLKGAVTIDNVTQRCRDEISRPKARILWTHNRWLSLLHRHHPVSTNPDYRSRPILDDNRKLLFDFIQAKRAARKTQTKKA